MALSSAACTACYVVLVGKLGDELQLDSLTLLLYNSLWSTPLSFGITILTGEVTGVMNYPHVTEVAFLAAFTMSCASAFVLNYATYLCTQLNDALTTSVVGRTKSVVQGVAGLFAFSVSWGVTNVMRADPELGGDMLVRVGEVRRETAGHEAGEREAGDRGAQRKFPHQERVAADAVAEEADERIRAP